MVDRLLGRKEKAERVIHEVEASGNLYKLLNSFNGALNRFADAVIRDEKKLDAIIQMLETQNGVPAQLGLIKAELEIIHGLVQDGGGDSGEAQEQIDKVASDLNLTATEEEEALKQLDHKKEN